MNPENRRHLLQALRDRPVENGGRMIPLPPAGTPFEPESRLYARSAADDKAPIIAIMAALDAIRAAGLKTRSNIKFAFEGEEEAGSPNLEKILAANKERERPEKPARIGAVARSRLERSKLVVAQQYAYLVSISY